ncbi:kinase-like protein [Schizopora paradoxa]|uniref:non-specific serine/threonine protein kinase n=1 Tax=Schizopora paradoxa TaxID=27342 RepID=A0A0H2S9V9_9AGAM|nr:kinase-like protein [Schizopora paradoxa]
MVRPFKTACLEFPGLPQTATFSPYATLCFSLSLLIDFVLNTMQAHLKVNLKLRVLLRKLSAAAAARKGRGVKTSILPKLDKEPETAVVPASVVAAEITPQQKELEDLVEEVYTSCLPPLSEKLANYDLKRALGRGAYGSVYLAQNAQGERIAIKVVKKSRLEGKMLGGAAEMKNEKDILSMLTKASVGKCTSFTNLHDHFQDGHNFYFVMDYASGGSLADELERLACPLSERRVQFYVGQLVIGLSFMHTAGFVHRDLKPDNCLITADGRLKIADFGLAMTLAYGKPSSNCGTPGYIAPEVYERKPYGFEVDMWSLGCIIFEMLFGYVPYDHKDYNEIGYLTCHTDFAFPSDLVLSEAAEHFVRNLLSKVPHRRIKAMEALSHPFLGPDSYVGGELFLLRNNLIHPQPHWIPVQDSMVFDSSLSKEVLLDRELLSSVWVPTAAELAFSGRPSSVLAVRSPLDAPLSHYSEEWEYIGDAGSPAPTRLPGASIHNTALLDIGALPTCNEEVGDNGAWEHCAASPMASGSPGLIAAGGNSWDALFDESIELVQEFEPIPLPEPLPEPFFSRQDVSKCFLGLRTSPPLIAPLWIPDSLHISNSASPASSTTLFNHSAYPSSAALTLAPSAPGSSQEILPLAPTKPLVISRPKGVRRMKAFGDRSIDVTASTLPSA